jgi:hypothetical protein
MSYFSEAEKLFNQEVRDKKRTASGVHSKAGKNGYVGKMLFPSDIMPRKEKIKHRKAGKVMISNLYEEILPIEEFEKLEVYEQKNRLAYWRNVYSNKEITDGMGIWNNKYYKIVAELELPKAPRINREAPRKAKAIKVKEKQEKAIAVNSSPIEAPEAKPEPEMKLKPETKPEAVQEILVNGIHLVFNGTYSPELIQKKLSKFELMLEDETDDFYIELKLVQKQKSKEEIKKIEAERQIELLQESRRLEHIERRLDHIEKVEIND